MIWVARETQDRIDSDYRYYCSDCDWFFKSSEVKEQTDGISDIKCPDCGQPLQEEVTA